MDSRKSSLYGDVYRGTEFRESDLRDNETYPIELNEGHGRIAPWPGPETGSHALTEAGTQPKFRESHFHQLGENAQLHPSAMTVARFVELKFVPEHVATTRTTSQAHYRAIMKHILKPEEVDRLFHTNGKPRKTKLKAVPDWPYLSNVRLCDVQPDHIRALVSAAANRGYSTQTAAHIRNVVSAILSHAAKERFFTGENPASQVRLSGSIRKDHRVLTLAQVKEALGAMKYPEKEMMLIAVLTGMSTSEIFGLQWKRVNLTDGKVASDGESIPPMTIAVRQYWYRGELEIVKKSRIRNVPVPRPLLGILLDLKARANFTGPDDFVLVSRVGTPPNQSNLLARRLKPLSEQLQLPPISWHLIRRTRKALLSELGLQFHHYAAMMLRTNPQPELSDRHDWRCRAYRRKGYY